MASLVPVPDHPDYFVTEDGRVWSNKIHNGTKGRWLKLNSHSNGYCGVKLSTPRGLISWEIHVLMAFVFFGPRPEGMQVDHIDRNKSNNRISNLQYITTQAHGRKDLAGVGNGNCKLTEGDVLQIRFLFAQGANKSKLSRDYNVSRTMIRYIVDRKSWTHV